MRAIVKLTIADNGKGSLALRVRIPPKVGELAGLTAGQYVLLTASKGKVILTTEDMPKLEDKK